MADGSAKLSTKEQWSRRWRQTAYRSLAFNPHRRHFRELHALFQRYLPKSTDMTFIEIGCYPGGHMWYFNHVFGYRVSGMEYVGELCEPMRELLRKSGVEPDVIEGDIMAYVPSKGRRWNVVASFGLVEHFSDPSAVVCRHLDLLSPGGYLILAIPNHAGINGRILRCISQEKYLTHNRMTCEDLVDAVHAAGSGDVLAAGYFGRLGFWNTGLYAKLQSFGRVVGLAVRLALWPIEVLGGLLPNTARFSPNIAVIVRKSAPQEPLPATGERSGR